MSSWALSIVILGFPSVILSRRHAVAMPVAAPSLRRRCAPGMTIGKAQDGSGGGSE